MKKKINDLTGLGKALALALAFVAGFAPSAYAANAFEFRRASDGVILGYVDQTTGNLVWISSVTASVYNGDGSALTGIQASSVAANAIGSSQVIDNSLTAFDLGPDSVSTSEIATDGVGSAEIAASAVGTAEVADNTLTSDDLAADSVASSEIATDAVGSAEIVADAVGASELAATAVTLGSYGSATQVGTFTVDADGRLTAAANVTVTPAASSITAGTLGAAVIASSVAANAVGSDQIAADAVGSSEIATDAVGSAEIVADAVTASELAADSVGTSEIQTDGVGAAEIAADAVSTSEIATDGVGSAEIAADAVGASELAATAVTLGSYGSATQVGTFTVDADGRLTAAANVTVTPAASSVTAGTFSGSFTFNSALTVSSLDVRGRAANTTICTATCSGGGGACIYTSSTDFDVYTATGSAIGQWRNGRTGTGACN